MDGESATIICVALNPAIDRTFEVDGLELGQHAKGRLISTQAAGKAVNVARVLQHLGQPCILTGFVGEGERRLFESGFDAGIVKTQLFGVAAPTRENFTLVDRQKGIETHVRDEGPRISEMDQDRLLRKLKILARPNAWMVFAGSLPRGLSGPRFYEMIAAITGKGAKLVLDSSQGASEVIRKLPIWVAKPNRSELAELAGLPTDSRDGIIAAARSLRGAVETCLVSAGPEGCYLLDGASLLRGYIDQLPSQVRNTVGCGDSLLAGYLAARVRGLPPADCLKWGVASGTSACFQLFAGAVDSSEVATLADGVTVDVL